MLLHLLTYLEDDDDEFNLIGLWNDGEGKGSAATRDGWPSVEEEVSGAAAIEKVEAAVRSTTVSRGGAGYGPWSRCF